MSDKHEQKNGEEINFLSSPSLQRVVKKSKWKQTMKYIIITILTTSILLFIIFLGSQYILNKRITKPDDLFYSSIHGANISNVNTSYDYNLFSITAETTYYKTIGDRNIIWDILKQKIPLFGRVKTLERGSGTVEINSLNKEAKRYVRYNNFNNQRKIDFYYPGLTYDYLPHELDIAVNLDKNRLIEVALSFKEPMTISEVAKKLGHENVNWLWVDTTTSAQIKKMERTLDGDNLKTKGGGGAFGFDVSSGISYSDESGKAFTNILEQLETKGIHKSEVKEALRGIKENTKATNGEILLNGAVVTGTPSELKRFQKLDFIRATVLGATIDKY